MDSYDIRNIYETYNSIYTDITESHFEIGDEVICKDSGMSGEVVKIDHKEKGKYYTVEREDGKKVKYAPDELKLDKESDEIAEDVRSRDINARGGFDPRFDKRPTTTGSGQVRTPGGPVRTPGGPVSTPRPTGPVAQAPKPAGGLLGTLDKTARDTAGKVGEVIGREKAKSVPGANLPILGNVIKSEGGRRGRNQGQQMYDKAKETVGSFLKQDYEPDAFDIIIEHLVAEGYADTNDNALVIMANMSEEWRQTILEAEVLAMKGGVPGAVKVRPSLSIPGTNIGVGPNKPVPGTFTTTTPGQREKIKQGDTHIDRGVGGMQPRQGAGPTGEERRRYNSQVARSRTPGKPMPQ